ncbi:MAG: hypothetical protein ACK4JX_04265 [Flavobacterium sp.]
MFLTFCHHTFKKYLLNLIVIKHIFLLLLSIITLCCCSKDDDTPTNPVDQLPLATQIGANKVGCLVNGEVFLSKGSNPLGPPLITCFYQFVNNSWHFSLGYSNNQQENLRGINIASKGVELQQGQTYPLVLQSDNSCYGRYTNWGETHHYITNNTFYCQFKITKLDQVNNIVSGTFWFDAVNSNGVKVEIREGRFDMQYSP